VIRDIGEQSQDQLSSAAIIETGHTSPKDVLKVMGRNKRVIAQSSLIGTLIGALPGAGADIAAWVSYGFAKKTSKHPEIFGTGSEEGVIAPTTANNAALGGTWIPALVFGIPGDTITAIVLGAMLMYGLKPGPLVFTNNKDLINQIFAVALASQVFVLILGFLGIKAFAFLFKFPRNVVLAGITVFSLIGAFAIRANIFDVLLVVIFGILGYFMEKVEMPLSPLILGLVLGPMIEDNLRIGLIKTNNSFIPFLTRPISAVFALILVITFLYEPVRKLFMLKHGH